MKVYLHYVEGCSPAFKVFKTKKAAEKFAGQFVLDSQGNADNWVDFLVVGEVIPLDDYYKNELKGSKNG